MHLLSSTYLYTNWSLLWYCLYIVGLVDVSPFLALATSAIGFLLVYALFLTDVLSITQMMQAYCAHLIPMSLVPLEISLYSCTLTLLMTCLYIFYLVCYNTNPLHVYGVMLPTYLRSRHAKVATRLPFAVALLITILALNSNSFLVSSASLYS